MQASENTTEILIKTAVCRHCLRPYQVQDGTDSHGYCCDIHQKADQGRKKTTSSFDDFLNLCRSRYMEGMPS